jgi:hypothetical protein
MAQNFRGGYRRASLVNSLLTEEKRWKPGSVLENSDSLSPSLCYAMASGRAEADEAKELTGPLCADLGKFSPKFFTENMIWF